MQKEMIHPVTAYYSLYEHIQSEDYLNTCRTVSGGIAQALYMALQRRKLDEFSLNPRLFVFWFICKLLRMTLMRSWY